MMTDFPTPVEGSSVVGQCWLQSIEGATYVGGGLRRDRPSNSC